MALSNREENAFQVAVHPGEYLVSSRGGRIEYHFLVVRLIVVGAWRVDCGWLYSLGAVLLMNMDATRLRTPAHYDINPQFRSLSNAWAVSPCAIFRKATDILGDWF
jgi:hypothetical protein